MNEQQLSEVIEKYDILLLSNTEEFDNDIDVFYDVQIGPVCIHKIKLNKETLEIEMPGVVFLWSQPCCCISFLYDEVWEAIKQLIIINFKYGRKRFIPFIH